MSENKPEKKIDMKSIAMIVMLIGAVAVVGFIMSITGQFKTSKGCNVNPQSAWGQTTPSVWVELNSYAEAKAVTVFDFETPENPRSGYDNIHYRAYTREIFEIWYTDDAGKEGIRFSKKHSCDGSEIYEVEKKYRSVNIVDVGGVDVTEYGDGETVSYAAWAIGDYSYAILAIDDPLTKEELEKFVPQLN